MSSNFPCVVRSHHKSVCSWVCNTLYLLIPGTTGISQLFRTCRQAVDKKKERKKDKKENSSHHWGTMHDSCWGCCVPESPQHCQRRRTNQFKIHHNGLGRRILTRGSLLIGLREVTDNPNMWVEQSASTSAGGSRQLILSRFFWLFKIFFAKKKSWFLFWIYMGISKDPRSQ